MRSSQTMSPPRSHRPLQSGKADHCGSFGPMGGYFACCAPEAPAASTPNAAMQIAAADVAPRNPSLVFMTFPCRDARDLFGQFGVGDSVRTDPSALVALTKAPPSPPFFRGLITRLIFSP